MTKKQTWSSSYPVVTLGAEYLVMGHLLRRNILTYKAAARKAAYDIICSHPDAPKKGRLIRVQLKCRLASDCDRGFPVDANTLDAFDYLILVFLNVGSFYHRNPETSTRAAADAPEFYTFPAAFIRQHLWVDGDVQRVETRELDIAGFKNEAGFEQIADDLEIPYPE